jgi:hypothetical protein
MTILYCVSSLPIQHQHHQQQQPTHYCVVIMWLIDDGEMVWYGIGILTALGRARNSCFDLARKSSNDVSRGINKMDGVKLFEIMRH